MKFHKTSVNLLLLGIILSLTSACHVADKKSNLDKDSIGGDTTVRDRIGGVETYETRLDEDASLFLKTYANDMQLEQEVCAYILKSKDSANNRIASLVQRLNKEGLKRLDKFATDNRVILPMEVDRQLHQNTIDEIKNDKSGKLFSNLIYTNLTSRKELLEQAYENRESKFKKFVKQELGYHEARQKMIQEILRK